MICSLSKIEQSERESEGDPIVFSSLDLHTIRGFTNPAAVLQHLLWL